MAVSVPPYVIQSAEKSADASIYDGPCLFYGLVIATDGTNDVTIDVYDNTAASGTKLLPTIVIPTSADIRYETIWFGKPVWCKTGIYVDITTAGTVAYMAYYFQL